VTAGQPADGWGHNLGEFIACYRADWVIGGRATGYTAQHRDERGRPRGPVLQAPTLDELVRCP
jgi:hypothetical protein